MGGFYKFARILIGAFLIFAGLNKFFEFTQMMTLSESAMNFMGAMAATNYFVPFLGFVEVLCGFMLWFQRSTPLAALMLAPWSLNVILFHVFLDPATILPALIIAAANVYFLVKNKPLYQPVFDSLTKGLTMKQFRLFYNQHGHGSAA